MQLVLRVIGILGLIVSTIWLIVDLGYESLLGFLSSLAALLGSFVVGRDKDHLHETLDLRNRRIMLDHVENYWVKGILEKSLHGEAIKLGILENPDAVPQIGSVYRESTGELLDPDLSKLELFKQVGMGRSLLILGEPGAGKTTVLLELAREQITAAREDDSEWLPVIVNLSSWASKQKPLVEWLTDEFKDFYRVSKKLTENWLESDALFLLLDGLDEVRADCRDACVKAISTFHADHGGIPLVVCSRSEDYRALKNQLEFQGAIVLQPLTDVQINDYFEAAGASLVSVKRLLDKDYLLRKMAQTPLMLSVMTLAYGDAESLPRLETLDARREHLFDTYIERMFDRPGRTDFSNAPDKEQTLTWLAWLAAKMKLHEQTLFLIEHLQPTWLDSRRMLWSYSLLMFSIGYLVFGSTLGIGVWLVFGLSRSLWILVCGLMVGLTDAISREIQTVDSLYWSWKDFGKASKNGMLVGILVFIVAFVLRRSLTEAILWSVLWFLSSSFVGGASGREIAGSFGQIGGLRARSIPNTLIPNQRIHSSFKNFIIVWMVMSIVTGTGLWFVPKSDSSLMQVKLFVHSLEYTPLQMLYWTLISGLPFGRIYGGTAVTRHFALRKILANYNCLPWKLVPFLDYCADRVFLRKVGGGYVFVHRLLLDHFAAMAE